MRNLASTTLQKCITTVMSFISAHTKNLDTKPVSTEEKKSASAAVTVASNVSADVESTMPSQGVDVQRYIHSETPIVSEKDDPKIEMEDVTEEKGMESITEERATDNNTDNAENKEDITGERKDITGEKEDITANKEDITANKEDTTNEKSPQTIPDSLFLLQRPPDSLFASSTLATTDGLAVLFAQQPHP